MACVGMGFGPLLVRTFKVQEALDLEEARNPQPRDYWRALNLQKGFSRIALRVQVPHNHILNQNLYQAILSPKSQVPNWVLGPLGLGIRLRALCYVELFWDVQVLQDPNVWKLPE